MDFTNYMSIGGMGALGSLSLIVILILAWGLFWKGFALWYAAKRHEKWWFIAFLLVALVWSVITMVVKPVLGILTLPITVITLGLFSFVLNAFLFYAMTWVVPGFTVAGFVP